MNGGQSTGYFQIKRGVRQGDPLSPYLFVLVIETLARVIRRDEGVSGVKLGDKEIRQIMYADDITIFVKDVNSAEKLKRILEDFEHVSGLKVNKDKTNFIWLGNEREKPGSILFGHSVEEIKILGVYFSRNLKRKNEVNYKEILSRIKRLVGWWKQRDLTIFGRIQLLKTYALSKINYISSLIVVPHDIFREVERISFEFVWGGKDRIKRKILYQDYRFGGLRMNNFEIFVKSQRLMWLKRLLNEEELSGWKASFDFCCSKIGGRFVFLCNYDIGKMDLKNIPPFYIELLRVWQEIKKCRFYEDNKRNPIIFNNTDVCIRNKTVYDEELFKKGICMVGDLMENRIMKPYAHFWNMGIKGESLLKIHDICSIIPDEYKEGNFMHIDTSRYDIYLKFSDNIESLSGLKSRKVYDYFIKQLQNDYDLQVRDGHSQFSFTDVELRNIFSRVKGSILCSKLREFQFKLLHGAVYTNENLFKFGFTSDDLCSFCKQEVETYPHLFLKCQLVHSLWEKVVRHLKLFEIGLGSWDEIFIGLTGKSPRINLCNTVIFC